MEQDLDSDFYVNNSEKTPALYYTRIVFKNYQSLKSCRLKIIFLLQALTKLQQKIYTHTFGCAHHVQTEQLIW